MNEIIPIIFSGLCGNCYLIKKNDTFILVDTATRSKRRKLERALSHEGCEGGNLKLIILTHGDFDHAGNAFYLKSHYGCPVAMHRDDAAIVETGKMFINKNKKNPFADIYTRLFMKIDRFTPDIFLEDGMNLESFGVSAEVLHLPGHSRGSLGILTAENDLLCGDLFENRKYPRLYFVDDAAKSQKSVEKLMSRTINKVYPGHGTSFLFSDIRDKI